MSTALCRQRNINVRLLPDSCAPTSPEPTGDTGSGIAGQHRHKIVPCFDDPRNLFAATPQHFDGPDAYGHLGSRVDGPGTGSLGNAPERIGIGSMMTQQMGHDLAEMAPGAGIGTGREVKTAKPVDIRFQIGRRCKIEPFENIGSAKRHLMSQGFRQGRGRRRGHGIQQPECTSSGHAVGERIGKIRTEPPRERLDQFRTSQNSFFFEVVTTKSFR